MLHIFEHFRHGNLLDMGATKFGVCMVTAPGMQKGTICFTQSRSCFIMQGPVETKRSGCSDVEVDSRRHIQSLPAAGCGQRLRYQVTLDVAKTVTALSGLAVTVNSVRLNET
jgi:hypothetical protein